jgi:hypothetical protein
MGCWTWVVEWGKKKEQSGVSTAHMQIKQNYYVIHMKWIEIKKSYKS